MTISEHRAGIGGIGRDRSGSTFKLCSYRMKQPKCISEGSKGISLASAGMGAVSGGYFAGVRRGVALYV